MRITAWTTHTTREPILPLVRHRRSRLTRSCAAIRPNATCRSRSCSAASAIPTCIRSATNGASYATVYPCVPGHEIVGRVTKVGSAVTKFKPGDLVAVGCLVDSDHTCPNCRAWPRAVLPEHDAHLQFPRQAPTAASPTAAIPTASWSTNVSCCACRANLNLAGAAPLLCAGITTYSPMRHWGVTKGKKVGVVGLGGLGHMGVKFAHAFGAHVVVFTTSPDKTEDALRLGADEVVVSRNADEMQKHAGSFDFILDAVSAEHDINAYLNLLAP